MMSTADQRMIAIEKTVCCSQIPRGEAKAYHGVDGGGYMGKHQVDEDTEGKEETVGKSFYCCF